VGTAGRDLTRLLTWGGYGVAGQSKWPESWCGSLEGIVEPVQTEGEGICPDYGIEGCHWGARKPPGLEEGHFATSTQ
jgi:hypothetical protein